MTTRQRNEMKSEKREGINISDSAGRRDPMYRLSPREGMK